MARSLIGGLLSDGRDPSTIWVSDTSAETLDALGEQFRVNTGTDNAAVCANAAAVVLAVKPQVLRSVARSLADTVQDQKPIVISIAAGVRAPDLEIWLGGGVPIVRAMPNTPALVGSGATGLFANARASADQRQLAESILRAAGVTVWVHDEPLLDVVTALSGSGPAYFLLVMQALEQAGGTLGLEPAAARLLTLQTAFGAAKMALESSESPAELRARVTSPGGTTERGISVLQDGGFEALLHAAVAAARQRAQELGDVLGEQS
jgi:pyrroline-5-carboxylate reductase